MTSAITTEFGTAIPAFGSGDSNHIITSHLPTWDATVAFGNFDMSMLMRIKTLYPRMMPHKYIAQLTEKIVALSGVEGKRCFLFPSAVSAAQCVEFATSENRGKGAVPKDNIFIRIFDVHIRVWAVFFPPPPPFGPDHKPPGVMGSFWSNAGVGLSTRQGADAMDHIELLHEVSATDPLTIAESSESFATLRKRITSLIQRAPIDEARAAKVTPDDVYLYQTGMSSIYSIHRYLLSSSRSGSTVLFGFSFHSTFHVFEDFGPGFKLIDSRTSENLDELEKYLKSEKDAGRFVQAVWSEFPSNPALTVPDLVRLRTLADEYGFILAVDDTIASFCNVDLLSTADVLVSSLTKSFSGYANVMGASAVLNPSLPQYSFLKHLFASDYQNDLYNADADVLEKNSRDYLERSAILNANAENLATYLVARSQLPDSCISRVLYPSTIPSVANFTPHLRRTTPDFKPGYGCLLSVELKTIESTIAFYDNLDVHQGPHLGAHLTLALPYVRGLHAKELDKVSEFGCLPTQVRVSVGLEDGAALREIFGRAVGFGDEAFKKEEQAKKAIA
ncbi:cystathionine gamma-synthase, converts cysteine into cystathionine [Lophium mytilinum]|uniref:Cystathionine gamma-synthase, converts cysteine into cystathionine n=1 Tax=Lophium mytilinum TaxID=390894 RepID=A0A6A6R8U5_9PEZI|nr:cystathionine gamma-synthase, converts cysteine into cystathionine [Lophium mytilinum]